VMKKSALKLLAGCGVMLCLLPGCGPKPTAIAAKQTPAFASADPQTKASWDVALAAMKTNGYAPALLALRHLAAQPNLTPEQAKAVSDTGTALTDQMYAAAKRGNTQAAEAIKVIDSTGRR
jgi:hypothetical protein